MGWGPGEIEEDGRREGAPQGPLEHTPALSCYPHPPGYPWSNWKAQHFQSKYSSRLVVDLSFLRLLVPL